jgi:hypothetical protein
MPTWRLKALLKATSDAYPTRSAIVSRLVRPYRRCSIARAIRKRVKYFIGDAPRISAKRVANAVRDIPTRRTKLVLSIPGRRAGRRRQLDVAQVIETSLEHDQAVPRRLGALRVDANIAYDAE